MKWNIMLVMLINSKLKIELKLRNDHRITFIVIHTTHWNKNIYIKQLHVLLNGDDIIDYRIIIRHGMALTIELIKLE